MDEFYDIVHKRGYWYTPEGDDQLQWLYLMLPRVPAHRRLWWRFTARLSRFRNNTYLLKRRYWNT